MTGDVPELTDLPPGLKAAMDLWEHIAAFAWGQFLQEDRGVVLVTEDDLLAAAQAMRSGQAVELQLSYVAAREIPKGDDFLHVISSYDPQRQIVLLIGRPSGGGAEQDEQLYVLEANENGRPLPRTCFEAMQGDTPPD